MCIRDRHAIDWGESWMAKSFRIASEDNSFTFSIVLLRIGAQTELDQLFAQGQARNAQQAGGLQLIAVREFNRLADDFALGGFEQAPVRIRQVATLSGGQQHVCHTCLLYTSPS